MPELNNDSVWQYLCRIHYNETNVSPSVSWKQFYKILCRYSGAENDYDGSSSGVTELQASIEGANWQFVFMSVFETNSSFINYPASGFFKFAHYFENMFCMLVVDLSSYQRKLPNGMFEIHKQLEFFKDLVQNPFVQKSFIIFFNKRDLFSKYIKETPLQNTFPHYNGSKLHFENSLILFRIV